MMWCRASTARPDRSAASRPPLARGDWLGCGLLVRRDLAHLAVCRPCGDCGSCWIQDRVKDEALLLHGPGPVPRVETEHDRVAGAERLIDHRWPAGQSGVRVDLVAVAVAEARRAAAVAGRCVGGRSRGVRDGALAGERGWIEVRVAA